MSRRVARHSSYRILIVLITCAALIPLPSITSLVSEAAQDQAEHGKGKPRPGKPEGNWPDLEDLKKETKVEREAPPPIPSTMRSPKNPLQPWNGRRVGDPGNQLGQGVGQRNNLVASNKHRTRLAHARSKMLAPPPVPDDQFIHNFFTWAVARAPSGTEPTFWNDQFRVAYGQGQTSLKLAAVELGKTLFESAEYAARNRDNHWYVYDLYKTFLMRDPDASGWAYWESVVPANGRENVRRAFEVSPEFDGIVNSITPNGAATANAASLISARVDPRNQPDNGMLTRDVSWSVPLISLPGRAGLDLGLALSYSSMVWTRSGPYIHFDEDNGFPSPGFRLGFPIVQRKVFDAQTAKNSFLLVTPAGQRVQLRQVGTSNIYEAADSSYLQLTDNSPNLLVRSTDGTQLSFVEINNEYSCTQIKDRNGNYISVGLNTLGKISTITDTLGRVINFNYDINANLISITQSWNGQPAHQWVSFGWGTRTMQSSFSDSSLRGVIGPANGTFLPVITQVALNDTSHFTFDYTNSLQVSAVRNYFGSMERHSTTFTYETPAGDAPRLLDRRVTADNWTGINGVPSQVITQYSVAGDGACIVTMPDGTVYKEYYGTGWQKGLTTLSEVWSGGVRQKWTTTAWTQDNTSVGYEMNPRITETNVYDAGGNRRRSTISYYPTSSFSLPSDIYEYAANATTVLRRTHINYNLNPTYTDRRIIGLPAGKYVLDGNDTLYSFDVYDYDYGGGFLIDTPQTPTQHDPTYGAGFVAGRGNLSIIRHTDATDPANRPVHDTLFVYNKTGSVTSTIDAMGHTKSFGYTDSFSDAVNRNTFAYPTTLTDEDGFSSYLQYNFDFGATTRSQSPAPAGQLQGAIQTMTYNNLGQLERTTTTNNGAYTRYIYGSYYVQSFAAINNIADEAYNIQVFDGVGRVRATAANHPGSTGGYRAQLTTYDSMGRAVSASNPTEITGTWVPVGDDAAGFYHTITTYDWKGRPLRTTNPDTTYKEASYSGCGCAGGEVVTLTDEVNRRRKLYSDVLGREWKTESLNWDGSVYSTSVSVFNVRDQITRIKQYAGAAPVEATSTNEAASCPNGTCQETSMTFDGYGRLQTRHRPEQSIGTATTYAYNMDDTLSSSTDARGAVTSYGYNGRHLVTSVTSALSGLSTINVSYSYDAAGNRTSMSHTVGGVQKDSATYSYDQLSRMTSETVSLNALQNQAPNYGSYTIGYEYTLSNQLKKVTDPFNSPTEMAYDEIGRTKTVTGTWNGANYTYANNVSYRAWGAVKSISSGPTISYNNRMRPTHYGAYDYTYYDDGKLKEFRDVNDQVGNPQFVQFHYMSRRYSYDHAGRISSVGQLENYSILPPFSGTYGYDAFDNLTSRSGAYALNPSQSDSSSYTNNRRAGWTYNAEGKVTNSNDNSDSGGSSTRAWTYDAAGALILTSEVRNGQTTTTALGYNGDGQLVSELLNGTTADYLIRSTVLGSVLTKLKANGGKDITYVPTNGLVAPMQLQDQPFSSPASYMVWVSRDPLGIQENKNGFLYAIDPFGSLVANAQPPSSGPPPYMPVYGATYGGLSWNSFINANNFSGGCQLDGLAKPCSQVIFGAMNGFYSPQSGSLFPFGAVIEDWKPVPPGHQPPPGSRILGEIAFEPEYGFSGNLFPEPDPQNPVPTDELERIRGDVEKSIAKCAGFLKALFDEAAIQTGEPYRDIMVTFDNIKFLYGTPGPGHGGETYGSFERGDARAVIREFKENFVSTDRSAFIRTQTAQNFLGETIHHVGTNSAYRDAPLANALNMVLFRQGKEPLRQFFERTSAQINTASFYLHDRVFTACQVRY